MKTPSRGSRHYRHIALFGFVAGSFLFSQASIAQLVTNEFDEDLGNYISERTAFEAADTNGDGVVSEAELVRDAAAGFSGLDVDGSRTLTPEELGPHDPALFDEVDTDGDGVLSFDEVAANKVAGFRAGDTNDDGGLSFDEMMTVVEQELETAQ